MTAPVTWTPTAREALRRIEGKLFATTTEAAVILDVDPRTLRAELERGEVPGTRVGLGWRIPASWLLGQARLSGADQQADMA